MNKPLRLLHVEDQDHDAALLQRHLKHAGYELVSDRVDSPDEMKMALEAREWDVVLCDYSMPRFSALSALALLKEVKMDIPFIIISGTIGEETAVEAMRAGAHDYLMKDSLARLVPAIERELSEAVNRRARRKAEAQLRLQSAALEAAANAILITDPKGNIIWVNAAFTETTGYSAAEVIGKNPRVLKSGRQDQAFYEEMWNTILSGKVWRNTVINRRKDGSLNHEDMTITPIRDESGKITQFIAIKQDITQLQQALSAVKQKSEELATMTQQLWQASKLATMGELSASIAHELNNPLAIIGLRVESMLMQLPENDSKQPALKVIANEVDRMAALVNNLLQFSRRSHRQITTVDVREEIDNTIEFVHYHLRTREIAVVRDFADPLPTIQADRQAFRQLFLNLLTNATDAMPRGGTLTLRVAVDNLREAPGVAVDFTDTGEGISSEHLEKIWDPFFTTKPEGKGTGLGLAICRRIVEEHSGIIGFESSAGHGTRVHIVFPATTTEPAINYEE